MTSNKQFGWQYFQERILEQSPERMKDSRYLLSQLINILSGVVKDIDEALKKT